VHDRGIRKVLTGVVKVYVIAHLSLILTGLSSAADCTVSTTSVTFGAYDVFSPAPLSSVGGVTVFCDPVSPGDVHVSIGQSPNAGFNPRQMKHFSLSDRLNYNLFADSSMTRIWGDGTGSYPSVDIGRVFKNRPVTQSVYGHIPPGQDVSAGQYSDILTVTINF
jgi:spore coat protein U-like protein